MPHRSFCLILILSVLSLWGSVLSGQIDARVEMNRPQGDSAVLIQVQWTSQEEQAWHMANDGRLDILGLRTAITSTTLQKSLAGTTTYTFHWPGAGMVEWLIEVEEITSGESVYLLDNSTQLIVYDFASQKRPSALSPAMDPANITLVWTCREGPTYRSRFSLKQAFYQRDEPGRGRGIGFGTALACHPNTACKQDSLLQLIAASTVRIRLVMEEGIGWCTGSFVNNTRNDKTPYLLTAFHCQYDFTPLYDMWRFDFDYQSPTCENPPTEPQLFSLTGCELISLGQASDFLLVKLDDQIPSGKEVTFAGWNRDDTAKPDTSYLIHDPNADIRKISTSVNQATIHPNSIGWTEGYTTPAFHHFRLKFTEGGHEHGSSGGPLFNQDGYLVGQLHGGTGGCENDNNAYVGRFAKSWNLGSTPQERLRDWLDPDATGLTQLPCLPNVNTAEIMNIHGRLTDPKGRPLKNAVIQVTGAITQSLTTGADGSFELQEVARSGQYILTPEKTDSPGNGVNAIDLIAMQKHLLGKDTFDFGWQYIAADATNNNLLSVGDIVVLQRLLLGKILALPSSPSWRFDPPQVTIDPLPEGVPAEVGFMGIKIGDVNASADPQK